MATSEQEKGQQLIEFCGVASKEFEQIMSSFDKVIGFSEQEAKSSSGDMMHRQAADATQKAENLKKIREGLQAGGEDLKRTCQMIPSLSKRLKVAAKEETGPKTP